MSGRIVLTSCAWLVVAGCDVAMTTGGSPSALTQTAGSGSGGMATGQAGAAPVAPTSSGGGSAGRTAVGSGGESNASGGGTAPFGGGPFGAGRGGNGDDELGGASNVGGSGEGGSGNGGGGSDPGGTSNVGGAGDIGGGGGESGAGGAPSPPLSGDITGIAYCEPTLDWDSEWATWEEEVLVAVNEYRAMGANCDTEGEFGPADPLIMDANLQCAARVHSLDMYEREFFDHTNPDGDDPSDRMDAAGYTGNSWGENIAWGQRSPQEVVDGWIDSDGHCSNIMNPSYELIGCGYYPGDADSFDNANYWTQTFGR